ncbi:MAG: WYL domain-containing protein [Coriobacteriia bacterium]|nr:WYL domain-containing protein [Coriobacteriia bacterium]
MAPKTTAAERARRLLAILPSLRPGAEIPLASLAASVGADPSELAADITTLSMCGVPPFDPYDLVDVFIDGETVVVGMALPALDRRVRLAPAEARALVAALETAGFVPGDSLLAKIAGVASAEVDADGLARRIRTATTAEGMGDVYATIVAATDSAESVDITYFSASSGSTRMRRVQPYRVFNSRGAWYVLAFDESVAEQRTFRLDRIRDAAPTGERFERPAMASAEGTPFAPGPASGTAQVRFDDATDVEGRDWPGASIELADGGADAKVPYATTGWLARRVAAAMGSAEVTGPAEMRDAVRSLAEKMLAELDE